MPNAGVLTEFKSRDVRDIISIVEHTAHEVDGTAGQVSLV